MANQEKDNFGHESFDATSLEKAGTKQQEALKERIEQASDNHEQTRETAAESARAEALETATSGEKPKNAEKQAASTPEHHRITKKDKDRSFNETMQEVRSQMSPANRAFSKVIHQPAVERISEAVGNTVARPNAILSGSLFAFLFTAAFYLVARFNGYPLSGSETIASFIIGWCVGLIFDYVKVLFVGKK